MRLKHRAGKPAYPSLSAATYASVQQQPHAIGQNGAVKEGNHLRVCHSSRFHDPSWFQVDLNETSSDELLEKWLSQAFSGLMAAVASKKISQMPAEQKDILQKCSKSAKDVPTHARCLVQLMNAEKTIQRVPTTEPPVLNNKKTKPFEKANKDVEWIGSFGTARAKRNSGFNVVNRSGYSIHDENDEDVMSKIAKSMTKTVRAMKNKDSKKSESWREAVGRIKKLGEEAKREKKNREVMKKRLRQMIDNTPAEFVDPRKPVALKQAEMEDENNEVAKLMRKKETEEIRVPLKFMRDAVKTAMIIGGQNVTGFDQKTLKMVSPRMMSIVPEQEDESLVRRLSLLSLCM